MPSVKGAMIKPPELFDSSEYYVPPPPIKLKVEVDISSFTGHILIHHRTSLWEVYHQWKQTEDPEDENNLASWLLEDLSDDILSNANMIDWEEV